MKKLLPLLLNPFVLAFVPALLIIWLLPVNFDRYLLDVEERGVARLGRYIFYDDLTGDGFSESINFVQNERRTILYIMKQNGQAINQWAFHGNFDFYYLRCFHIRGDMNGDGQKEMFVFTISNDSIFLHAIFDYEANELAISNRLLAVAGQGRPHPDPWIVEAEMEDLNGDGVKELVFGISSGYSLYPRNVFAYYIKQDSLVSSPESYFYFDAITQADVTGNGAREVILSGYSPANIQPGEQAIYHDYSNWLMVLDQNLDFLFDPVEFPDRFKYLSVHATNHLANNELHVFYRDPEEAKTELSIYDASGQIQRSYLFPYYAERIRAIESDTGEPMYVFRLKNNTILLDHTFNVVDQLQTRAMPIPLRIHEHQAGQDQLLMLLFSNETGTLSVYKSDMMNPASAYIGSISVPVEKPFFSYGEVKRGEQRSRIFFQANPHYFIFNYGPNPRYYLNFLIYGLIYLGLAAFAYISRGFQKHQIKKRYETEKKITSLQMNMVKNQLDPHFTLNAINAVLEAVRSNEFQVAEQGLMRFAGMYRQMLLSAESIRRRLDEEVSFTENYLELERLRSNNAFSYEIVLAPDTDPSLLIPKMIIQVHAENAVKHGLLPRRQSGLLKVRIAQNDQKLEIFITDNGVGRDFSAKNQGCSTGLGLSLMGEFYALYEKFYNQRISSYIRDLKSAQGAPDGTSVHIIIYLPNDSKRI